MLARLPVANLGRTRDFPGNLHIASLARNGVLEAILQVNMKLEARRGSELGKTQNIFLQDVGRLTFLLKCCISTKVASHLVSLYQSESPKEASGAD